MPESDKGEIIEIPGDGGKESGSKGDSGGLGFFPGVIIEKEVNTSGQDVWIVAHCNKGVEARQFPALAIPENSVFGNCNSNATKVWFQLIEGTRGDDTILVAINLQTTEP